MRTKEKTDWIELGTLEPTPIPADSPLA
jgi:hypothetical protein